MNDFNTNLWDSIDSARVKLSGVNYYDPDLREEIVIPPKNGKVYAKAYNYVGEAASWILRIDVLFDEINITKKYIEEAPLFNEKNEEFSLDILLNYSYKNWLSRVNTLGEVLIHLAVHILQIRFPEVNPNMMEEVFNSEIVKKDRQLYSALLNIVDFLKMDKIPTLSDRTFRKIRNNIAHTGEFSHTLTSNLSRLLFEVEYELKEKYDETDLLIDKNIAARDLNREVQLYSHELAKLIFTLFEIFEISFKLSFERFMLEGDAKSKTA